MSDITINYKGSAIATMDASGTKTLLTEGKYCEDDITVDYVKPSGGGYYTEGTYTVATATRSFSVSVNFQPKYAYAFVTNWRELTHTSWLTGSVVGALNGSYQRGRFLTRINNGTYGSNGNVLNDTFFTYSNGILTFDTASGSYKFPAGGVIEWFAAGDGSAE